MNYVRHPNLAALIRAWLTYRNHKQLRRAVIAARGIV